MTASTYRRAPVSLAGDAHTERLLKWITAPGIEANSYA
jgi:hypothetical protein